MSPLNLSKLINSMSELEQEKLLASLIVVKDINKVPPAAFETVSVCLKGVLINENEEAIEALALTVCQYLSLNNMLITNVDDKALSKQDFDRLNIDSLDSDSIFTNFVFDYKLHHEQIQLRTAFIAALTSLTTNQDILTSGTNFIFYHSSKLSEDDEVNRDLALINLIKLCIKDGLKEPLKALLIDLDVDIDNFIIQHIQMFVS
jgi:hypothetical protein